MPTDFAQQLYQHGGSGVADLEETLREVETIKAVRFCLHAWMPFPNFGPDGFRFNVHYPELPRLEPIVLPTVTRPEIKGPAPRGGFGLLGNIGTWRGSDTTSGRGEDDFSPGFGGNIPAGQGAQVEQVYQRPAESVYNLLTAFGGYGLVELKSMASDEGGLELSFLLFEAVMGEARSEEELDAGRRPAGLVLEDFPGWLSRGAPDAFRYAAARKKVSRMVRLRDGRFELREFPFRATPDEEARAEALISAVAASVKQATTRALNPDNGVLPKTRRLMQVGKNGGVEGKHHHDTLDLFLMGQFPSFPMDTDVDRAQTAVREAVVAGGENAAAVAEALRRQAEVQEMIARNQAEATARQDAIIATLAEGQRAQTALLERLLKEKK